MASIFTKSNDQLSKPNRNTFDRSFTNNLTLKFGKLTPCFCKEVIPNQSVRIKPTFGFNFMPMVFPVQTRMRCNLHFFYVRNRPLWRGWMDFYGDTENKDNDITPPYMSFNSANQSMLEVGGIADYMGIPVVSYIGDNSIVTPQFNRIGTACSETYHFVGGDLSSSELADILTSSNMCPDGYESLPSGTSVIPSFIAQVGASTSNGYTITIYRKYLDALYNDWRDYLETHSIPRTAISSYSNWLLRIKTSDGGTIAIIDSRGEISNIQDAEIFLDDTYIRIEVSNPSPIRVSWRPNLFATYGGSDVVTASDIFSQSKLPVLFRNIVGAALLSDRSLDILPYYSAENTDGLKVSALPFRAYEAIYNSFYRDERNNPLLVDGKEIYNSYITTDVGGADSNNYELKSANWYPDAYTTAVQSPQQGILPLVGVTATGTMTFEDEAGKSYTLQANIDDDGNLTGIQSHSSDMPTGTLRAMVDTISTGISINDFRNVNALQRWLEKNMRRGLRYKDIVRSHFGNNIKYSETDVPEFIGGISRMVDMNKVIQTSSDVDGSPLGTLAGMANIFGTTDTTISHFCDEPGWIIGIISVVPEPIYSQRLDKQFTKENLLDYYFPEFAHIGFQPIFNKEITPLQLQDIDGKRALDVFGYQRAWHEYISSFDECHGEFQTTMRDYIIHRVFSDVPQLSEEFLTINQQLPNNVFADTSDNDKIFGQIHFDFKTKLPMPKYGIPRLEA